MINNGQLIKISNQDNFLIDYAADLKYIPNYEVYNLT